jgi:predicted dienelactone hydrolase
MIKRILKLIVILASAAVMLAAAAIVYFVVERSQNLTLPAPAGPYPVGRMITTWTDESRQESLGGAPGQHRTLSVWIWYPAEHGGSTVPYMPPDWARARDADRGIGSLLFQTVESIHSDATDAGLSSQGGLLPVLIFEPGLGPLIPEYTTLAEDLASRGYVVIGLNPTYSASITVLNGQVIAGSSLGTIPDDATPEQAQQRGDELVAIWAADDRFAIGEAIRMNGDPGSRFAGRLDVQHVGLLGHSLGGAAALEACHLDARCAAAVNLDGWPYGSVVHAGLDRPLLLVLSEPGNNANTPAMQKSTRDLAAIFANVPLGYQVRIRGARHFNFTDLALGFHPFARQLGVLGSTDGARGLRITSAYLAAFFDQTLKNRPSSLLHGTSKDFPEVQFTSHPAKTR